MLQFLLILTLVTGVVLLGIRHKEPRTLFYGASFSLFSLSLAGLLGFIFFNQGWIFLVAVIGIAVIISLSLAPMVIVVVLIYNGFTLIKREGFRLGNTLTLAVGVGLILYLTIWPGVVDLANVTILNSVYGYVSLLVFYIASLLTLYSVTTILNLVHLTNPPLDYLIVLGAGLAGDQVTPLLATRIDRAIKIHHKQPHTKLIMTGGQGDDELIAEGLAMANYARAKGIAEEAIIIEDRAVNTEENIAFSYALVDKPAARVGVVSNTYHVLRALLLAKEQGYECVGYGARTKLYFSLNAYIREFVAYLYMKRRLHFWGILFLTIFYGVIQGVYLIIYYVSQG